MTAVVDRSLEQTIINYTNVKSIFVSRCFITGNNYDNV